MKPEDLGRLNIPTHPRVAPDGSGYVFVVSTPNVSQDENQHRIWVGGQDDPQPLTSGPDDRAPRWSPSGDKLAFLREVEGSGDQVAIVSPDGGDATVITDFPHGVEDLEWAPDGSSILAVGVTPTEDWAGLDDEERSRRPRRVTTVPFRYDDKGWTHDRRRHLWLVDPLGNAKPRCLTPGDFDEANPAWSPDGRRIAFISVREPHKGLVKGNRVWELELDTGQIAPVSMVGTWIAASYDPSGSLHLLGNVSEDLPRDSYLYRLEDDGSLTNLTGHLDRSSYSYAVESAAIRWDGADALVGLEDSGRFGVIRVSQSSDIDTVVEGERVVSGFDSAAGRIVFAASAWDSPGELYETGRRGETAITMLNQAELSLIRPSHHRTRSGDTEIDVWTYLPAGNDPVPLLLNIHGGPASQYGWGFFDEFQVYAGAGYGVVACNPRGSSGRGLEFNRAVIGEGWGARDHEDIGNVVASALESHPRLDPQRLGIMGGSYGGFLTAWIIGRERRWKSAVVERALLSWTSFAGTSDIGGTFPDHYTRAAYPDAWETWWRLSPLALAHNVTTPTLMIHSEDDFRCPIEQAEQYFMALLRNGTTTELVRFPGEGHELSRSGSPRHRVERFEAILDWHERHLRDSDGT